MTSKMISIKEEVYKQLRRLKNQDESFSDLLTRLIENQEKNPLKYYGIANTLPEDFLNEFENAVMNAKKENALNSERRFKDLWGE